MILFVRLVELCMLNPQCAMHTLSNDTPQAITQISGRITGRLSGNRHKAGYHYPVSGERPDTTIRNSPTNYVIYGTMMREPTGTFLTTQSVCTEIVNWSTTTTLMGMIQFGVETQADGYTVGVIVEKCAKWRTWESV